jgi:hypothetical protein
MDVRPSSLPPKLLVADKLMPIEQTTEYMAARGCHFVGCSLCFLLINIEFTASQCAISVTRESSCIKYQARSCQELSKKFLHCARVTFDCSPVQMSCPAVVRKTNRVCSRLKKGFAGRVTF